MVAHQTAARVGVPNKTNNVAIFDNLNVRKYLVDIGGERYQRDGVSIDYASKDYLDHYRDLKLFFKEYVGEELLKPFIRYTYMKNKFPIQVIVLRFQVDHIFLKKILQFQDYRHARNFARIFLILIGYCENILISDGNRITENNTIKKEYF